MKADKRGSLYERYGPAALVTGAAQGLGAEFADQIAAAGLDLVLVDIDAARLGETCEALRGRHRVEIRPIVADLSREDLLERLLPQLEGTSIHLLVNNAGVARLGPFLPQERDFLLTQLHVNTRAVLLLSHALGNRMRERGRGGIIILSSAAAFVGSALNAHYAATKAYDLVFAESLWAELSDYGVDVLGFMPGNTDTPGLRAEAPRAPKSTIMSPEDCVALALASLGRTPSIVAGTSNRIAFRAMTSLLPRSAMIRLVSRALRGMVDR